MKYHRDRLLCLSLEENWWLACVLEVCSDTKVVFLHPHVPSNLFKYPETQNIHTIPVDTF